jgi:hypothetical protein
VLQQERTGPLKRYNNNSSIFLVSPVCPPVKKELELPQPSFCDSLSASPASMSFPPCASCTETKAQYARTFVVNTTGCPAELLTGWAARRVVGGDGAFARVRLLNDETYLVLTLARSAKIDLASRTIAASVAGLPGSPQVAWVRPLTRRLQALFRRIRCPSSCRTSSARPTPKRSRGSGRIWATARTCRNFAASGWIASPIL